MHIQKVKIRNFKCFRDLELNLNNGLNILVGDNETGKSTILEAIHLALSGFFQGKYLKAESVQYLFNTTVVNEYLNKLNSGKGAKLPKIEIELFFAGGDLSLYEGKNNSDENDKAAGIAFKVEFANRFEPNYERLIKTNELFAVPIEYYHVTWTAFSGDEGILPRIIPIKSALIDSSQNRYQNGADIHLSHILDNFLDDEQKLNISQSHREMKTYFMGLEGIKGINDHLRSSTKMAGDDKAVTLSVDLSSRNMWEGSLHTCLDEIPFYHIGKGQQSIVKTKLALEHKKTKEANVVLLEEPENHLSHSNLNKLISIINAKCNEKQIVISTHSSFVANKLGLENLVLLHDGKTARLTDLDDETQKFFKKIPGYDTLRLLLCKKAILVEGDADELIVQKAYRGINSNRLPIQDGIDVISVGTSFLRFLEIAKKIRKPVSVVTDNDSDPDSVRLKYQDYLSETSESKDYIKICFDSVVDVGDLKYGNEGNQKKFNYNTLEPKMLKANSLKSFNKIFGKNFDSEEDMHIHMRANKTECALKIFETDSDVNYPTYILDSFS